MSWMVAIAVMFGIGVGVLAEKHDERLRWGSCTSMQVTSKDTRTAVQIRRDMDR
jgi:hypothetical protein